MPTASVPPASAVEATAVEAAAMGAATASAAMKLGGCWFARRDKGSHERQCGQARYARSAYVSHRDLQSSGSNGVKPKEFPFSEESRECPKSKTTEEALRLEFIIARRSQPVSMSR
jgi:hypothetical protein